MLLPRVQPLAKINKMKQAFAGIDVAFAKNKRLPVAVCVLSHAGLEPLPLRRAAIKPPVGKGNACILNEEGVNRFADETAAYLKKIESEFGICIQRVAIDAPSAPKVTGATRRQCEVSLDRKRISCITTPSVVEFEAIRAKAASHLARGGAESQIPSANQLWMLIGFALFKRLRQEWECIEVFPQAIAAVLDAQHIHKSRRDGLLAQLGAVALRTRWPARAEVVSLAHIAYGSLHDRLDAYLSAWVASLEDSDRVPIGIPPDDVIWVPKSLDVPSGTKEIGPLPFPKYG